MSTPVRDVVDGYPGVVDVQEDLHGFANACRRVREQHSEMRDRKVRALLHLNGWDAIARHMGQLAELVAAKGALPDAPADIPFLQARRAGPGAA